MEPRAPPPSISIDPTWTVPPVTGHVGRPGSLSGRVTEEVAVYRLTLRNLMANRVRFALTVLGVTLAVSFVVSAFVLGDGLRSTFADLSRDITAGVDLEVRPVAEFGDPTPLPFETVGTVASVDGVADAVGIMAAPDNSVRPIRPDGRGIPTTGPPQLAFAWVDNPDLSSFSLEEGSPPGPGEFVMDFDGARRYGFEIGMTYRFVTPSGSWDLTMSGTSRFGADNATVGAVLMQMNARQAPEIFGLDGVGGVSVSLEPGADSQSVASELTAKVPGVEVLDNASLTSEAAAEYNDQIDLMGNILLGFGGVSLFVSAFIISNTFGIVVSQRTRELALLRAIGADPGQVRRSVMGEALVVGVVASIAGLVGGVAVARGLEALFGGLGASLPDSPTVVATRTVVAALVIGMGVTLVAAVGPARKASTVAPMEAMTDSGVESDHLGRRRMGSGLGLVTGGLVLGSLGLFVTSGTVTTVVLLGTAAVGVFVGTTLVSPVAVGPLTRLLAGPVARVAGVSGRLARENAGRNPRRTATTAGALMIGLALVTTAMTVGQSVKAGVARTLEQDVLADYLLTDNTDSFRFPAGLAEQLREEPAFGAVTGFQYVEVRIEGEVEEVTSADFSQIGQLLDLELTDGGYDTSVEDPLVVSRGRAEADGIGVGDTIAVGFSNGREVRATVTGIFAGDSLIDDDFVVDTALLVDAGLPGQPAWLALALADGVDPGVARSAVEDLAAAYPGSNVDSTSEFGDRASGFIDQSLAVVNIMVALAVIIALIGIANTLALSVFERTRELGLLRAVGMTRRQLRRMVRYEAALVASFGSVLGVAIGLLFGWGVVIALPNSITSSLSIPVLRIAALMGVATAAGVTAALLPARRAAHLDVLAAISG